MPTEAQFDEAGARFDTAAEGADELLQPARQANARRPLHGGGLTRDVNDFVDDTGREMKGVAGDLRELARECRKRAQECRDAAAAQAAYAAARTAYAQDALAHQVAVAADPATAGDPPTAPTPPPAPPPYVSM